MIEDLIQNTVSISTMKEFEQNIYWDCYQGYTTMEDQRKEDNFSFEQIELAFYEEHYGNYVMKQNERHVKARHPDRCKEVEDVWKNKKDLSGRKYLSAWDDR